MSVENASDNELEDGRRSARKRRAILDAATTSFLSNGYLGTSMDEIARTAGVGPATLYRRFPTKEALLDAVLGDVLERFHGFAEEALKADDAFAGLELLI